LEINQLASLLILLYYFSVEFVVGDKPGSKFTVWDTKTKLKIKTLQQFLFIEMSFNHSKLANWFISNNKLYTEIIY
jgi:hypothetical protein